MGRYLYLVTLLLLPFIFCTPADYVSNHNTNENEQTNYPNSAIGKAVNAETRDKIYDEETGEGDVPPLGGSGIEEPVKQPNDLNPENEPEPEEEADENKKGDGDNIENAGKDVAEDNDHPEEEQKEEENQKEETIGSNFMSEDEKDELDLFEVNAEFEKKAGGVLVDENEPGSHVDQGDIMFDECEQEELFLTSGNLPNPKCKEVLRKAKRKAQRKEKGKASQRDATLRANSVWGLPIAYQIDAGLRLQARTAIRQAIQEYTDKTCITFVNQVATDYLRIFAGTRRNAGCWSRVGRRGGRHDISLSSGCWSRNTAIHEIMHALGFYHEQSRTDRNQFVTINLENVEVVRGRNMSYNFDRLVNDVTTYNFGYDYLSTMHYSRTAFGIEYTDDNTGQLRRRETITPVINTLLGQCSNCGLSLTDALQLNARYCNTPQAAVNRQNLLAITRNWMAIYQGIPNEQFRNKLLDHLRVIYPKYLFFVSSYNPVEREYQHAVGGANVVQVNAFGRNVVVGHLRRSARRLDPADKSRLRNTILRGVLNQGCDAPVILNNLRRAAGRNAGKLVAYHTVESGLDLFTQRNGVNAIAINFSCARNRRASLVLLLET